MSELRLTLPECKYRNDMDELMKDQFIFGIHNKEIQDHLLGEIKETDNSVRVLYEVQKVESKLAQRQMLGIVNPSNLVSVEAIRKRANILITQTANFVDALMAKVNALPLEKLVTHVVVETILNLNALRLKGDRAGPVTEKGQIGPGVHTSAVYMKFARKKVVMTT